MKEDKFYGLSLLKIIFCFITIIGIWFIYKEWIRRKTLKKRLIGLIPQIRQALEDYKHIFLYEFYFSFTDEQKYLESYRPLSQEIGRGFESVGLNAEQIYLIEQFLNVLLTLAEDRKRYNEECRSSAESGPIGC